MAIVSLSKQHVTIYDANGWIMRAPVSSGRKGYETPAGIYTVVQKEADHYSNLYEDGYMPFMQRITWSGIALHGGPLPGYPASHGCVRMPVDFAERLFSLTKLGMRLIVAPGDPVGIEMSHPFLSSLNPARVSVSGVESGQAIPFEVGLVLPGKPVQSLQSIAAAKAREAEEARRKADAARFDSVKKTLENSRITAALHMAESAKSRLEAHLRAAQSAFEAADMPETKQAAPEAKDRAVAKLAEAEARYNAALVAAQNRPDVIRAREQAEAAAAESTAAAEAAAEAARKARPVSIFISRKTQQLYVRQSFQPIFDAPVTIKDPDQPIGTHVFRALNSISDGPRARAPWLAVTLESFGRHQIAPAKGLLTIGDAASFIDPFTGSGMLMALQSGELVAGIIADHFRRRDQLGDGKPHRLRGDPERRAARCSHQKAAAQSGRLFPFHPAIRDFLAIATTSTITSVRMAPPHIRSVHVSSP